MKSSTETNYVVAPNEEEYADFLSILRANFLTKSKDEKLYVTSCKDLFNVFLSGLPIDDRQHYNCNACRQFVNKYGKLVTLDDSGTTTSVMWSMETVPEFFGAAVEAMKTTVETSSIKGVWLDKDKVWGKPITGQWRHMAVEQLDENRFKSVLMTSGQARIEKREDFLMLQRSLSEFSVEAVNAAIPLLKTNALSRSDKVLGIAEWFKKLHDDIDANKVMKRNLLWRAVGTAPKGFTHIKSSMIGSLLEDIVSGLDIHLIKQRFNKKMGALNYQRPKALPTDRGKKRAEEIVAKLECARSFDRRYARIDEVESIWIPKVVLSKSAVGKGGMFDHIKTKEQNKKEIKPIESPAETMTWVKFRADVMPLAERIELLVPRGTSPFCAFVTAMHADAPPIIRWDKIEKRNPMSHYVYYNGSLAGQWCLVSGTYVDVDAITNSPATWGETMEPNFIQLILHGARDTREDADLAIFPETLIPELRGVRSSIEALSQAGRMQGADEASACGLMLHKSNKQMDVALKVTYGGLVYKYHIDRFE